MSSGLTPKADMRRGGWDGMRWVLKASELKPGRHPNNPGLPARPQSNLAFFRQSRLTTGVALASETSASVKLSAQF
jgi:hypothetical protein